MDVPVASRILATLVRFVTAQRAFCGKSLISSVEWNAPASGPLLSIGGPGLRWLGLLGRAPVLARAARTRSSFFLALTGAAPDPAVFAGASVLCTTMLDSSRPR